MKGTRDVSLSIPGKGYLLIELQDLDTAPSFVVFEEIEKLFMFDAVKKAGGVTLRIRRDVAGFDIKIVIGEKTYSRGKLYQSLNFGCTQAIGYVRMTLAAGEVLDVT